MFLQPVTIAGGWRNARDNLLKVHSLLERQLTAIELTEHINLRARSKRRGMDRDNLVGSHSLQAELGTAQRNRLFGTRAHA